MEKNPFSKFKVKEVSPGNRGLFATSQIKKNQEIIESQPIASATIQEVKKSICNYCLLQKLTTKCSACKSFYYCSTECQKKDWPLHKLECKIFSNMLNQKNLSVLNQITTEFVFQVRLYFTLQTQPQTAKKFYQMCDQQDSQGESKKKHFLELSTVLMQNLGLQKNEANLSKLLKQLNIVSVNAFTIQDLFYTTNGTAVGLYFPQNYFNHECSPNCIQVFDGRYLKIISQRDIEPNQELTISYTSIVDFSRQRSRILKQNYLFDCFCELCHVERMLEVETVYVKCPHCKQGNAQKVVSEEKFIMKENQQEDTSVEEELLKDLKKDHSEKLEQKLKKQMKSKEKQAHEEDIAGWDLGDNEQKQEDLFGIQSENKKEGEGISKNQDTSPQTQNQRKNRPNYTCNKCQKQIQRGYISEIAQEIQKLPEKVKAIEGYQKAKEELLRMKSYVDLKHPSFCQTIESVYLKTLNVATMFQDPVKQNKLFQEAYILLCSYIKHIPDWYKLGQISKGKSELKSMRFFNKFNEMSKLAYNLGKKAKCLESLQICMETIEHLHLHNSYIEIKQLQQRYNQIKIEMSMAKSSRMVC